MVAAAAVYLSGKIFAVQPVWPAILVNESGMTEYDLRPCAHELCKLLNSRENSELRAVRKKFALPRFREVSTIRVI